MKDQRSLPLSSSFQQRIVTLIQYNVVAVITCSFARNATTSLKKIVMVNPNRGHSRRKRPGLRCIRCIRAKKGPCLGGKPTCHNCASKNLLCVWEDESVDDAEEEMSVVVTEPQ